MSNSLQDRIAAAISEIGAHILQHGRDMYGETAALADAQQVLRDCAAALKKEPAPEAGAGGGDGSGDVQLTVTVAKPEPAPESPAKSARARQSGG